MLVLVLLLLLLLVLMLLLLLRLLPALGPSVFEPNLREEHAY